MGGRVVALLTMFGIDIRVHILNLMLSARCSPIWRKPPKPTFKNRGILTQKQRKQEMRCCKDEKWTEGGILNGRPLYWKLWCSNSVMTVFIATCLQFLHCKVARVREVCLAHSSSYFASPISVPYPWLRVFLLGVFFLLPYLLGITTLESLMHCLVHNASFLFNKIKRSTHVLIFFPSEFG